MTEPSPLGPPGSQSVIVLLSDGGDDRHKAVLRHVSHLADGTAIEFVAHRPGVAVCLRDDTRPAGCKGSSRGSPWSPSPGVLRLRRMDT